MSEIEASLKFSKDAADRIEARAKKARLTVRRIGMTLFAAIYFLVFAGGAYYMQDVLHSPVTPITPSASIDNTFASRLSAQVSSQKMRPNPLQRVTDADLLVDERQASADRARINDSLDQWERVKVIEAKDPNREAVNSWSNIIIHGVLGFGLVAFIGFIIQIAIMFMRYYARLAEFYDTQVDALRLSGGDVQIAIQFMEMFSPNVIDLGRSPKTVHESTIEALADLMAKSRPS